MFLVHLFYLVSLSIGRSVGGFLGIIASEGFHACDEVASFLGPQKAQHEIQGAVPKVHWKYRQLMLVISFAVVFGFL